MPIQPNPCQLNSQTIIFDFDGVLVESLETKTEAFRDLFKSFPDHLDLFIEYHMEHAGISRFQKIRFFFNQLLKKSISEDEVMQWAKQYGELVVQKVILATLVNGADDLLQYCHDRYNLFVASGTPEEELQFIIRERRMDHFFKGIFGSPQSKSTIVQRILTEYNIDPKKTVFIGDAKADLAAAKDHHLAFIARINDYNEPYFQHEPMLGKVKDMTGVRNLLGTFEQVIA